MRPGRIDFGQSRTKPGKKRRRHEDTPHHSQGHPLSHRPPAQDTGQSFHVVTDQIASLQEDVQKVRSHPLIPDTVAVGGFMYYVDTGLIDQKF